MSMPASSTQAANLIVLDLSPVAQATPAQPVTLASWNANDDIEIDARRTQDVRLHSMGVSPDGTRAYLAYLGAGFLVLDTSPLTNPALVPPIALRLRTPAGDRAHWGSPGTHSAVEIFGKRVIDGVEHTYALHDRRGLRRVEHAAGGRQGPPRLPMGLDACARHHERGRANRRRRIQGPAERDDQLCHSERGIDGADAALAARVPVRGDRRARSRARLSSRVTRRTIRRC